MLDVNTHKVTNDVSTAVEKGKEAIEKDKSAAPKPEEKGLQIKANSSGVELQGNHLDVKLPPLNDH
jgi:hypothetical protein